MKIMLWFLGMVLGEQGLNHRSQLRRFSHSAGVRGANQQRHRYVAVCGQPKVNAGGWVAAIGFPSATATAGAPILVSAGATGCSV